MLPQHLDKLPKCFCSSAFTFLQFVGSFARELLLPRPWIVMGCTSSTGAVRHDEIVCTGQMHQEEITVFSVISHKRKETEVMKVKKSVTFQEVIEFEDSNMESSMRSIQSFLKTRFEVARRLDRSCVHASTMFTCHVTRGSSHDARSERRAHFAFFRSL